MEAILLDGTADGSQTAGFVISALTDHLTSGGGHLLHLPLRDLALAPCRGCFGCWIKTPGQCVIADAGRDVARYVSQSDLTIFLSPITFGGYSSTLKRAVDRLIPITSPFFTKVGGVTRHKKRYVRYPSLLAIGILPSPSPDSEAIFRSLVEHNALNLHSPVCSTVILYGDQTLDDVRQEIHQLVSVVGRQAAQPAGWDNDPAGGGETP